MPLTRRSALGLAMLSVSGLSIAGCHNRTKPAPRAPRVNPDSTALMTAREGELSLLASYDAQLKSLPLHKRAPLQVERAIHAAHLAALRVSTPPGSAAPHVTPHLHSALRASATQLRRLALDAVEGTNAALLASIAASHTASAG